MSTPSSDTEPSVARSCPEIRLKKVVLPARFGPTIAVKVPGVKAQDTWSTATWPPKRIVRFLVSSMRLRASADDVVVRAGLLQGRHDEDVPQTHVLVRAVGIGD